MAVASHRPWPPNEAGDQRLGVGGRLMAQHGLFPLASSFDSRRIDVGDGHILYLEQFGVPDGTPAVFLHGGPGSGCQRDHARLFDPRRFRVILFDQRGAGRSTPKRGLAANTTWHLVADLEAIRQALAIDRWLVVGGSWGSTLGLAYAESHPERVLGLVLRAVFLGTRTGSEWAFVGAAQTFYPSLWRKFVDLLPEAERADPVAAYGARLEHSDPAVHEMAARTWGAYERALSVLKPDNTALPAALDPTSATGPVPNTPYLEWHYMHNDWFMQPDQLHANAWKLEGIPGTIVQGRYDLLCPPRGAVRLAQAWPDAVLHIVPGAGHSASEPGIAAGLVAAINNIKV